MIVLNEKNLLKSNKIAVAWSGGIDSTAILIYLKLHNYEIEAWHVDHAWKDINNKDNKFLSDLCKQFEIPLKSVRLDHAKSDTNREKVARDARYDQFETWSKETGIKTLCLGHHKEDNAETVYMRLLAGSGPYGCRAIREKRKHGYLMIVRPALHLKKIDLSKYLLKRDIMHIEDSSNNDNTILRNRVRHVDIPSMNNHVDIVDVLCRLSKCAENLCDKINHDIDKVNLVMKNNEAHILAKDWSDLTGTLKKYLLQKMGRKIHGDAFSFGKRHLNYAEGWSCLGSIDISKSVLKRKQKHIILCSQ